MPTIVDKLKLDEKQDRRIKITSDKKEEIRNKYSAGEYSLRMLANEYGVCKKTILLIVNEESKEKDKLRKKENWKKYQRDRKTRTEYARRVREYKRELYKKGELK